MRMSSWFSTHTHSQFSPLDGMTPVPDMVHKVALMGQPGLGLTDHGNMAGSTQLYKECRKRGILPFPGIETYVIDPNAEDPTDGKASRFHVGLLATNYNGYKGLVKLSSLAHTRPRFNRFARLMISDLAEFGGEYGDDVVLLTGCFFGLVQQSLVNDGIDAATRAIKSYASWFPNTIVEIQNHNIDHGNGEDDGTVATALIDISRATGLPIIATQDSHYLDQKEKAAHALMKRMVYSGGADDEFPGDSFHLASAEWVREHHPSRAVWAEVENTCDWLIARNKLVIPALEKFHAYVPQISNKPDDALSKKCWRALSQLLDAMDWSERKRRKYTERLREELSVIAEVGMANYFLLWVKFVEWCRTQKICFEARGSANGSLVCYLLSITQIDPIKWGTLFERFMSRDRIKPPDIDMDIEDGRRDEAVAWLERHFSVVKIGTWSELGESRDAITGEASGRGSVLVSYMSYLRRESEKLADEYLSKKAAAGGKKPPTKKDIGDYAKRIFAKRFGHVKSIEDVRGISVRDYKGLRQLARMRSVYRSFGVHAAGLLLGAPDLDIESHIPTMLVASSDTRVTQYDMDDLEEWGLLKKDYLGQATLTVMRLAQEMIGREDPCDFTWIPENDRQACRLLREGRTDNGIFHFEGYTKAKGGKEMGIASTKDAVIASAIYMPGAMESGQKDHYLKHRVTKGKNVKYLHPAFEEVLSPYFGAVIFQEQPLEILRKLGMSIENINKLFKVVKDSGKGAVERNAGRMAELRKEFNYLCTKNGIREIEEAWHLCTGFINYGFNKAHAAGYGLRSYRCAYLKAHYPLEFMTALLMVWSVKNGDKEKLYAREARRLGIRLLPPDVNTSKATWTIDRKRNAIRRGLVSIKGIGVSAANEISGKAPYESVEQLIDRCNGHAVSGGKTWLDEGKFTGKLLALKEAGALDSLLN